MGHSRPLMRLLYLYLYSHSRRNFLHHAVNTQLCGKTSHCKWSKQHSITGTCRWSIHCECTYTSQSAANWVFAVCPHDEAQRNALTLVTSLRNSTVLYSLLVSSQLTPFKYWFMNIATPNTIPFTHFRCLIFVFESNYTQVSSFFQKVLHFASHNAFILHHSHSLYQLSQLEWCHVLSWVRPLELENNEIKRRFHRRENTSYCFGSLPDKFKAIMASANTIWQHFIYMDPCKCPTRCDLFSLLYFCRQLYMFRVLTPIISSLYSCNYSFWYWLTGSTTICSRDTTYSVYYISLYSCTCFGCWHPSSGAGTTVITASGID